MNELKIFNNQEFGQIRVLEKDGEPWFVAKDVSDTLGYDQTSNMVKRLDEEDFISSKLDGMSMKSILINESGLYTAILGSQLPTAKKFKRWVTSEVLPSIRKHGAYIPQELSPQLQLLINMEMKQKQLEVAVAETKQEVQAIRDTIIINPKAEWRKETNKILTSISVKLNDFQSARNEAYKALEERGHCRPSVLVTNLKSRALLNGMSKSKVDSLGMLDVLENEPRLREIYISIVKEMAIKYKIA